MEFDEWLNKEIGKLKRISVRLKEEFGTIDRDYQKWLFEDAKEPFGFSKQKPDRAEGGSPPGNGSQSRREYPLSEKQKAAIAKHLDGKLGPEIAAMIKKTGKPLDRLSTSEASVILDFIFGGGKK